MAGQGAFSDCAAQEEIIGNCSNQHLQYLSADKAAAMQQVAQIDDALYLVRDVGLRFICKSVGERAGGEVVHAAFRSYPYSAFFLTN